LITESVPSGKQDARLPAGQVTPAYTEDLAPPDRAGAAVPFAPAGRLLADLAGIDVNAKAIQRTAEADGQAAAAVIEARAAAITARTLVPLPPCPLPDILYTAIDAPASR
jgi:hypothetical protein